MVTTLVVMALGPTQFHKKMSAKIGKPVGCQADPIIGGYSRTVPRVTVGFGKDKGVASKLLNIDKVMPLR